MKNHLFLLLSLLVSTNFYAMDDMPVALLGEKKENADWSELASKLVAEYEIPIVLGSTLGLTGAASLYKRDTGPLKAGCFIASAYGIYKLFLEAQNDNESIRRIDKLTKTLGKISTDVQSVQADVTDIKVVVGGIQTDVTTMKDAVSAMQSNITKSTEASKQTKENFEITNRLLVGLIADSNGLNQKIKELREKQSKVGKDVSQANEDIRTTDTENSDLIIAVLKNLSGEPTKVTSSDQTFSLSTATR